MKEIKLIAVTIMLLAFPLMSRAEEKVIPISPKVRIIAREFKVITSTRIENEKIQFLDKKGKVKKEIKLEQLGGGAFGISPDMKRIAIPVNWRWKYNDKEKQTLIDKAIKVGKPKRNIAYPQDLYSALEDIAVYDDDGQIKQTITVDINVYALCCSNKGEVVAYGRTSIDRTGERKGIGKLLFYDEKGNLLRCIDAKEAIDKGIAIGGSGKIYQEDKIVWVGKLAIWGEKIVRNKGSAVTLFDLKGNIIWQYNDKYFSASNPDIIAFSPDNNYLYIKGRYIDWSIPNFLPEKTWVLDKKGNLLKILDGWKNEIE